MSFTWHEIHEQLLRTSSTLDLQHHFRAIRRSKEPLRRFADPAGLLDALHRGAASPDEKNRQLTALVEVAQSDLAEADCALTLTLLALWPGLDAVFRRARWRRLGDAEHLTSEVLARATEAIRCLDLRRVNRIAATTLLNIERDLVRARQKEVGHVAMSSEIDPDEIPGDRDGIAPQRLHDEIGRLIGRDADLVCLVAVAGFTQAEVAVELSLSEAAARKRYQRAIGRLREATREHV